MRIGTPRERQRDRVARPGVNDADISVRRGHNRLREVRPAHQLIDSDFAQLSAGGFQKVDCKGKRHWAWDFNALRQHENRLAFQGTEPDAEDALLRTHFLQKQHIATDGVRLGGSHAANVNDADLDVV
jgi:hypothetical protein